MAIWRRAKVPIETNVVSTNRLLNDHRGLWYLHALLMDANRTLAAVLRRSGEADLAAKAESEAEMHRSRLHEDPPGRAAAPTDR